MGFRFVREQSEEGETEDSRVKKMHQETADATMTVNSTTGRDVSLAGIATSIIFVATKHVFCCDKSMLVVTKKISRNLGSSRQNVFVATKVLSQKY